MSEFAIFHATNSLKSLLVDNIDQLVPGNTHIGAPIRAEIVDTPKVTIFLFHIQPNAELRNQQRFKTPTPGVPVTSPAGKLDSLPLDARYMITVFREGNTEPNELSTLGKIMQLLHSQPTLNVPQLPGQFIRLTPEPYPMEEISRIWTLFPQDRYRTSVVYLASPIFVDVTDHDEALPVVRRIQKNGIIESIPSAAGQQTGGS